MDALFKVATAVKRIFTDAAALAVLQGTLLLSFAYHQTGMESFSESLISAGQTVPPNVTVDVPALLPSPPTVRDGTTKLEKSSPYIFQEYHTGYIEEKWRHYL